MDIGTFTDDLELREGIFYSKTKKSISYPDSGNEFCLELEEESFWFKHRNDCIKAAVSNFSKDKVFWDIGGGNGYVAKGLQDIGVRTILLEPGETGVRNAKNRGLQNIICSTLENSGIRQNSMESAGAFDVIEHIDDDLGFLKQLNSLLEENGVLYLTVPAYNFLWSNEDEHAGHYRRYTLEKLNKLLNKAGFSVLYSTYFFSILTLPILAFRTLPSKLGWNKDANRFVRHKKEHKSLPWTESIIKRIWSWELKQIVKAKRIPMGGSCLIIARKNS